MPSDALREQLQTSLGAAYSLTRELGGGGMSRVFVARDASLGRDVVVKVLAPELAAGLSAERFAREIRLAASLQQANIVPVHAAGTFDGPGGTLPYYTMPFVEGESLRHRLTRGPLAIGETVAILRDVAKALAYAHARDIVHRDIKPDNVLLSGGTAVVTDFGIAKALGAARTNADLQATVDGRGAALTGLGSAIGTPAYMAPEQAAGDPAADARVDVYAFGCLAYELLAGVPPFHGRSPQRLLAAHLTERPAPVESLRPDTPPALAALVARCLEKEPDVRPASTAELLRALDVIGTTATSDATQIPTLPFGGAAGFRRALLIYAIVFIAVAGLTKFAITAIGLPDWTLPGALVAMGLALPLLLFTGYAQRVVRHAATATPTSTPNGTPTMPQGTVAQLALRASPHLSWRRAARWGAVTLGAFAAVVVAFMTLRAFGIGPVGTLFAAGTMREGDAVVVADFTSTGDTTLGRTIAQGVKTDLGQSRAIRVVDEDGVARMLGLMKRPGARLTLPVAREVAERAGAPMVVDGAITSLGNGFVVSLRLVTADSGREVVGYQEAADSPKELIDVVGRLTRDLRAHVGESLRDVQRSRKLAEVSTSSIEALRRYTEAYAALSRRDVPRFTTLMHDAIALDSTFALAYVALAVQLSDMGLLMQRREQLRLISRAYELRERLPAFERHFVEAQYYVQGPRSAIDTAKARAAFRAGAEDPRGRSRMMPRLGIFYLNTHNYAAAESVYRQIFARDTLRGGGALGSLIELAFVQGRLAAAESLHAELRRRFPRSSTAPLYRVTLLTARGAVDSAEQVVDQLIAAARNPYVLTELYCRFGMQNDAAAGRMARFDSSARGCAAALEATGDRTLLAALALWRVQSRVIGGDRRHARALFDSLGTTNVVMSVDPYDRPDAFLATIASLVGDLPTARAALQRAEAQLSEQDFDNAFQLRLARSYLAIAERRWDDAIREARLATLGLCQNCGELPLAMAYEGKGQADSAIAAYERSRIGYDFSRWSAQTLRRLGELYEAKGDATNAIDRYQRFVALWQRADPALQPQVAEVRARIAGLQAKEARTR